jgi:GT2 family glycosyltransferase
MSIPALPQLSVCVPTRNRPQDIVRCLNSLALLKKISFEIIVLDDASESPVEPFLMQTIECNLRSKVVVIRNEQSRGVSVARNQLAQKATGVYILSMDDDAELLNAESIETAVNVLETDEKVGAVSLAQMDGQGQMFPGQPAPVSYNCYVPWYIGYGTVLRRSLFVELGGYRESFAAYEEAELCIRMHDQGFCVVYLPNSVVIHHHSLIGRSELASLKNTHRNRCFAAIYNQPLLMMIANVIVGILRYFYAHRRYCHKHKTTTKYGVPWLLTEIRSALPSIWSDRKALKWSTFYSLYKIKQNLPIYQ